MAGPTVAEHTGGSRGHRNGEVYLMLYDVICFIYIEMNVIDIVGLFTKKVMLNSLVLVYQMGHEIEDMFVH